MSEADNLVASLLSLLYKQGNSTESVGNANIYLRYVGKFVGNDYNHTKKELRNMLRNHTLTMRLLI